MDVLTDQSGVRRPFAILSWLVASAGIGALALSWVVYPPEFSLYFVFLLAAALISENYTVVMGGYSFSIAYPLTIAALVLCGPTPALILAASSSVNIYDLRTLPRSVNLFNLGQLLVSIALSGWVYVGLGGRVLISAGVATEWSSADFPGFLLPLLAVAVVSALGNVALASLGVAARTGEKLSDVLESVGWLPAGQVAFGAIGFIIAQVMAIAPAAFVFFIFPLLVARQFYQRFSAMKSAYVDTIRSLIGALEAKDPYTRGHSERVAEYSVLIGRAAGMDSRSLADLEYAALLHDLGKIALPGPLLRKPGKLDDAEWSAIKGHPGVGASMVRRIPPLKKLADTVSRHHERLDGTGYPEGLSASELATSTRILAIADSFDAMTSNRPYRPGLTREAAIAELRRCSPHQLDADLVEVFVQQVWQKDLPVLAPSMESLASVEGEQAT